jgi:pentatricopeptide repeat protein
MLSGYLQHEEGVLALQLFEKIDDFNIIPDICIFTCILKACGIARLVSEAMLVHCSIVRASLEYDVAVGSSLIDVYSKCGCLEEARKVFDTCPEKNEVSWGAMLSGYNQHGQGILALELFQKMLQVGEKNPDKVRLLCVLKACGSIGASLHGKMIHALIKSNKVSIDVVLGNAIIDMYAKCGNLEDAYLVFNELKERDIISWGAMIAGYAQQGRHEMVKQFIQAMRCEGLSPNDVIYSSILSACSHSGEVEEGYSYFNSMKLDHGISPSYELTNCMVDLLGRAGRLNEAEKLLQANLSSLSDSMAWTSLLTACRTYGNLELGKQCYNEVVHLSPNVSSGYVTMSNIFADAHL